MSALKALSPAKLIGDFAFAIWDPERRTLFCARDPMGVRPFYYFRSDRLFAFASELKVEGQEATVTREVDGGLQAIKVRLPAVVTVDLRMNEPRYASLPNIMKAKKKPLEEKTPQDYGVDVTPRLTVVRTAEPPSRKAGVVVKSVDELVDMMKGAGLV